MAAAANSRGQTKCVALAADLALPPPTMAAAAKSRSQTKCVETATNAALMRPTRHTGPSAPDSHRGQTKCIETRQAPPPTDFVMTHHSVWFAAVPGTAPPAMAP